MPQERVKVTKVRTLGAEQRPTPPAKHTGTVTPEHARETLKAEFDRVLGLKNKLAAEATVGGKEKGRDSARGEEKMRALVASLEGASRFALQLGLITPAENRELFAEAMKHGLYDGWTR